MPCPVLNEIMSIPEQQIPPVLLRNAYGIAIIPGLLKAGFLVGARYGTGILVIHRQDGSWSNPVFVTLTGGSFGLQIGAQSTDCHPGVQDHEECRRHNAGEVHPGRRCLRGGGAGRAARGGGHRRDVQAPRYIPMREAGDSLQGSPSKGPPSRSTTMPIRSSTTPRGFCRRRY